MGLSGLGGSMYYDNTIKTHNQLAQDEANEQLNAKVQHATFFISDPLPTATLPIEKANKGSYHIVAGVFRVETNSDRKVNQLKALGYNAQTIGKNKYGLYQVIYDSYQTRDEAQMTLSKIKQTHNSSAWLLVKSLD